MEYTNKVIIVGAGLSGICMAIALKKKGIDFVILEKNAGVGGTWFENRYPGAGCDIPMFAYCYSFERFNGEHEWPKQPEILAYFEHCVEKYDIAKHIRFNATVNTAQFDEDNAHWDVSLTDGSRYRGQFFVSATGQLNIPHTPQFAGMDAFKSPIVHSAEWQNDLDVKDKVVGIVGNGATTLQIVEALQPIAKKVHVFARSAKYIFPRVKYSPLTIAKMKRDETFWLNMREQFSASQDKYHAHLNQFPSLDPFNPDSDVKQFYAQSNIADWDEYDGFYKWLEARDLRPDYPTGCSRPLASNTYHNAIREENVELVTQGIERFDETGVICDGEQRPLDMMIMATGFDLNNLVPKYDIIGANNRLLADAWAEYPQAYLGMAAASYPNLFFLYGPNTNTNSTSVTFYVECQVNYIMQILAEQEQQGFNRLEVKPEAVTRFTDFIQTKSQEVAESAECSSWYKNKDNLNISTFPASFDKYAELTAHASLQDYIVHYPEKEALPEVSSEQINKVKPKVVEVFASTTGLEKGDIDTERALGEYPLDSMLMTEFINKINQRFDVKLETVVLFECATLAKLAERIAATIASQTPHASAAEAQASHAVATPNSESAATNVPMLSSKQMNMLMQSTQAQTTDGEEKASSEATEAVAVISAAGYFPQADSAEALWQNLIDNQLSITEIPETRWNWHQHAAEHDDIGESRTKWGGFVNDVDLFDPLFFKISPTEAEWIDPQQRLFLQCCWELIERAGYNPFGMSNKKVGVILGINLTDYAELIQQSLIELNSLQMSGLMNLFGANRVSYLFGFTGPSEVIDTACSSSLVAVHRGIQSLRQDNCDMVIAGGANLMLSPKMHLLYAKSGMLAEDGRCKPFSDQANGYVRGEGVAAVLLKKLSRAEADGDTIMGVIRGSAENHGGKAVSLTAPNQTLQAELIYDAMSEADFDPRTIGYIECHGTGTALGDPIEFQGLSKAFENRYKDIDKNVRAGKCGLGSIKSNIGHLETAAGVAGLIKVLMSMKHQTLPATLFDGQVNKQINLEHSPFYLVTENQSWEPVTLDGVTYPRRAGVSSFGAGGTNAHVVLEEYIPSGNRTTGVMAEQPNLFLLSAQTQQQLVQKANDLHAALSTEAQTIADNTLEAAQQLASVAYTLQLGREEMDFRLAIIANSYQQLCQRLTQYVAQQQAGDDVFVAQASKHQDFGQMFNEDAEFQGTIDSWLASRRLSKLAELWVKGVKVAWQPMYAGMSPQRVMLPGHPFNKRRYWFEGATQKRWGGTLEQQVLLPMIHKNVSDFSRQAYSVDLNGNEFFTRDHKVKLGKGGTESVKVLPGVAYLEMVFEAYVLANGGEPEEMLEFSEVAWLRPLLVSEKKTAIVSFEYNEDDEFTFSISSLEGEEEVLHCQGLLLSAEPVDAQTISIAELKDSANGYELNQAQIYQGMSALGLDYGPSHRAINHLWRNEQSVFAEVAVPDISELQQDAYFLHPSLLDGILQACNGLVNDLRDDGQYPFLPIAVDSLAILAPCAEKMYAQVRRADGADNAAGMAIMDIDVFDESGKLAIQIKGLNIREARPANAIKNKKNLLAEPVWVSQAVTVREQALDLQQHILLCGDVAEAQALRALLPQAQIQHLDLSSANKAEVYTKLAEQCLTTLQSIWPSSTSTGTVFQVVLNNDEDASWRAGIAGLLQSAMRENARLNAQVVFVDKQTPSEQLSRSLTQELNNREFVSLVRYQDTQRQIRQWTEVAEKETLQPSLIKEGGCYLITGGSGGLGLVFARWIASQVNDVQLVITGRKPLNPALKDKLATIPCPSERVHYEQVDLTDIAAVNTLFDRIAHVAKPLNGIFHLAGMVSDGFLINKTPAGLAEVLAPKVQGTLNLSAASDQQPLDFMVLFSSLVSWAGNAGQADYAAANGFLDGFASMRNAQVTAGACQGKTVAINWPLWASGGMGMTEEQLSVFIEKYGLAMLSDEEGIALFSQCMEVDAEQVIALCGDRNKLPEALAHTPGLSPLQAPKAVNSAANNSQSGDLASRTEQYFCDLFARLLKLPEEDVEASAGFERYGIDSILSMTLTRALEKDFGTLSKTLFFEYQTIAQLSEYFVEAHPETLATLLGEDTSHVATSSTHTASTEVTSKPSSTSPLARARLRRNGAKSRADNAHALAKEPIAIIGISGRYPESEDLAEYWNNLAAGRDCISEVPESRWDWREYYSEDRTVSGHHFSKWGGFIAGVDEFDPRFFNISPKEALTIDPQERLFLQHAWLAMEDAGYTRDSLQVPREKQQSGQVGVYAGVMYSEYQLIGAEASMGGQRMGFASSPASVANRVSYVMNVHGPSMTVDTMCSSSLTAIHLACQDLKLGRTDMALAGGVNVTIHPNKYLMLSAGQFISSDGHCQSFGEGGDGYIPAEGVGVVLLKLLSKAEADGDAIHGVIRGSALNHGGHTRGYSVPNPNAQTCAIEQALADAQVDPRHISYLEAHGTGTKLGDPIEIAGLSKAFYRDRAPQQRESGYCLIGSSKSNIGHGESAAGIAGLSKVLLQMRHRQIAPSLHSQQLNQNIDFEQTPFVVNQQLVPWEAPIIDGRSIPRLAGLSSFGAGGSNAHLIIEEYVAKAQQQASSDPVLVPLSARTYEQLQARVSTLLTHLDSSDDVSLQSLAYTLQLGREAMDERMAMVVDSVAQLQAQLRAFSQWQVETPLPDGVYYAQVKASRAALSALRETQNVAQNVATWLQNKALDNLAELWVKGQKVSWDQLYLGTKVQRMHLPVYQFARERYWVEPDAQLMPVAMQSGIHPLLQMNTSTLHAHGYRTEFKGTEPFISTAGTVPAEVCLEMARAAVECGLALKQEGQSVTLSQLAWGAPVTVAEGGQSVSIDLFNLHAEGSEVDFEIYSQTQDAEIIHCQGHGQVQSQPLPTLALNTLKSSLAPLPIELPKGVVAVDHDASELLIELAFPESLQNSLEIYAIHPEVVRTSFAVIGQWLAHHGLPLSAWQQAYPQGLAALHVHFASSQNMVVRVSRTGDAQNLALSLAFCDSQGRCYQQWEELRFAMPVATSNVTAKLAEPEPSRVMTSSASTPALTEPAPAQLETMTEVQWRSAAAAVTATVSTSHAQPSDVRSKPSDVVLQPIEAANLTNAASLHRPSFTLVPVHSVYAPESQAPSQSAMLVRLYQLGQGVYRLAMQQGQLDDALIEQFNQALDYLAARDDVNALLVSGESDTFLQGAWAYPGVKSLYQRIVNFAAPTIAMMQGDALGAGLCLGALCDQMVCAEASRYGLWSTEASRGTNAAEQALWEARLGRAQAADLLFMTDNASGEQWRRKGWSCPVVAAADVERTAREWAGHLAGKSTHALQTLKAHLTAARRDWVAALTDETEMPQGNVAMSLQPDRISDADALTLRTQDTTLWVELHAAPEQSQVAALIKVLNEAQDAGYSSLVLSSAHTTFLPEVTANDSALEALMAQLVSCPILVVAALTGDAQGRAWLLAQSCDAIVYNRTAQYGDNGLWRTSDLAFPLLSLRIGETLSQQLLLGADTFSGDALPKGVPHWYLCDDGDVMAQATRLTATWQHIARPEWRAALARWKGDVWTQLSEQKTALSTALQATEQPRDTGQTDITVGQDIVLNSKVISATAYPNGVVQITMADRQVRNMFSPDFIAGMDEVFAHIAEHNEYKVVVLTGYNQYFASGGTKETLLAIQRGEVKFTDEKVFQLPLNCDLPVIAAMQGHSVGAGWALGMFADVPVFSAQSHYISPYMNYGFTPGAGSTLLLPRKLGQDLGIDSLFSGHGYEGSALSARGLACTVVPRQDVMSTAMTMAQALSQASRSQLMALKAQWRQQLMPDLAATYTSELAMHEATFVGRSDTLALIESLYANETQSAAPQATVTQSGARPQASVAEVIQQLSVMLATELHMDPQELDPQEQFVDLGLDSITGVTWVRAINAKYGLEIEATQVYNYPTLQAFSDYVSEVVAQHAPATVEPAVSAPVTATRIAPVSSSAVTHTLTALLAGELHMGVEELDEHEQFVDLGLDSITGVTWVKAINAKYGLEIEATQVYSYPTLHEFSGYVSDVIAQQSPQATDVESTAVSAPVVAATPVSTPASVSTEAVETQLAALLAAELHMTVEELDAEEQFVDLGLDSITGVTWVKAINAQYGLDIEATQVYSYPTLRAFSDYVSGFIAPQEPAAATPSAAAPEQAPQTETPAIRPDSSAEYRPQYPVLSSWRSAAKPMATGNIIQPIAIIGMSGQFAGAENLTQYWEALASGQDMIKEVPEERWSSEHYYQASDTPVKGKTNSKWLGALTNYDTFDPLFFNLSPKEAMSMDPQQRLFLESCWNSIEDAGYAPQQLSGSRCGVFVGCASAGYQLQARELQVSAPGFTGDATSILAARIAYFMNLQGPCVSIDTACSSSLVAISQACDSLTNADSDMALAGGVYVMSGPELHLKSAQAGMLSPDGRCFTFDQRANGFVPGEGVGVVMLKRLRDAQQDGDNIHAVLQGWGVNQDGKTNGITAPSAQSQSRLERSVYDKFAIDPEEIQLVEAHGTGTPLGDPIEVEGLKTAFKAYTDREAFCALGSVKSNIGHCLAAAGVAGVIKVVLALKHRQLPPTLHVEQVNEHVSLKGSPFYINDRLQPWEVNDGQRRQGVVSSFGFSGTNAHMVVAEPPKDNDKRQPSEGATGIAKVIPLSAKTPEQLTQRASDLAAHLSGKDHVASLTRLAYTLQTGREEMNERLCIYTDSISGLVAQLNRYVAADKDRDGNLGQQKAALEAEGIFRERVGAHKEGIQLISQDAQVKQTLIEQWLRTEQFLTIAHMWSKGLSLNWLSMYEAQQPQRVSLPTYPFGKERFWFKAPAVNHIAETILTERADYIHPLLQQNISKLGLQAYSTKLQLDDAQIQKALGMNTPSSIDKHLPKIYAEMARLAVLDAYNGGDREQWIELYDVHWVAMGDQASDQLELQIALFNQQQQTLEFEVFYVAESGKEVTLCHGYARVIEQAVQSQLNLESISSAVKSDNSGLQLFEKLDVLPDDDQRYPSKLAVLGLMSDSMNASARLLGLDANVVSPTMIESFVVSGEQLSAQSELYVHAQIFEEKYVYVDILLFQNDGSLFAKLTGLHFNVSRVVVDNNNMAVSQPVSFTQETTPQLSAPQQQVDRTELGQYLTASLAQALYLDETQIDPDTQFTELGVDSIIAVEWVASVNKRYHTDILVTTFYQYPTLNQLADYVAGLLGEVVTEPAPAQPKVVTEQTPIQPVVEITTQPDKESTVQYLIASLAEALYLDEAQIDVDTQFTELGVDSIIAVEWVSAVNKHFDTNVLVTTFYQYPTINKLADYVAELVGNTKVQVNVIPSTPTVAEQPVAQPAEQPAEEIPGQIDTTTMVQYLTASLAEALYLDYAQIDPDTQFTELGVDSIIAVEWVSAVNKHFATEVLVTTFYQYPSINKLADYIARQTADKAAQPSALQSAVVSERAATVIEQAPAVAQPVQQAGDITTMIQYLTASLAEALYLDEAQIDSDTQFTELGVDSIIAVEWVTAVNRHFNTEVLVTTFYQYPTISKLADYIASQMPSTTAQTSAATPVAQTSQPITTPAATLVHDDKATMMQYLTASLADALYLDEAQIDPDTQFTELGVDSIIAVEWVAAVNRQYGTDILVTTFYQYPTIAQLATYLATRTASEPSVAPSEPAPVAAKNTETPVSNTPVTATPSVASTMTMEALQSDLKASLADALYLEEDSLDNDVEFADFGVDSIIAVEWVSAINRKYGTNILVTTFYQFPSISKLAPFIWGEINKNSPVAQSPRAVETPKAASPAVSQSATAQSGETKKIAFVVNQPDGEQVLIARRHKQCQPAALLGDERAHLSLLEPVAIIGMAGQFPQANDIAQFWDNIAESRDCITEVPNERWRVAEFYQHSDNPVEGKANSKWMGELIDADKFDPLFFNISPSEAEVIDPQQRLFLQNCWHTIEHAGYDASELAGSKCGVFVGCGPGDYLQFIGDAKHSAQALTGGATSILAARIAYHLDLQGPCVSIDTACSSSLVAIANACDSLDNGSSDIALAGGVCVMSGPSMHIMTSQSGMLSTDGKCYTFDDRANGFVPGEGVGVVMLKRLSDAEQSNDTIHAVIKGWGVNQDGKTNGITAPNPESQTRLQQDIYRRFAINPEQIQLIEAHGTGTKLGDPVEIEGLKQTFCGVTGQAASCALGSVKSNIGHTLAAAGVAGVIKLTMAIKHQQLPPTINYEKQNSHIHLEGTPFFVNDKLQAWSTPKHHTRHAAVSSFGFSGTNAHLVVAEHTGAAAKQVAQQQLVNSSAMNTIVLSARTKEQLRQKAGDLLQILQSDTAPSLADIAYTLQVGRAAMEERLALMVVSKQQLIEKLTVFVQGKNSVPGVFFGQVARNKESLSVLNSDEDTKALIQQWITNNKLHKLLALWVKGLVFDWNELYGNKKYARCQLPLYPFAKERYWLANTKQEVDVQQSGGQIEVLHPLLHTNASDFYQQRYQTCFSGDEFYLTDHLLQQGIAPSKKLLPGVAYLEMARAGLADALRSDSEDCGFAFENIVWLNPVIYGETNAVSLELSASESHGETVFKFEIVSDKDGQRQLHCEGMIRVIDRPDDLNVDLIAIQSRVNKVFKAPQEFYQDFASRGLCYGPAHQPVKFIKMAGNEVFASLELPEDLLDGHNQYQIHPAMMDGALQTCAALLNGDDTDSKAPALPFAIDSFWYYNSCKPQMYVLVTPEQSGESKSAFTKFNIELFDDQGTVCAEIKGFSVREKFEEKDVLTADDNNEFNNDNQHSFNEGFYEDLLARIENQDISVEDAVELE
ncbi:hypothetical protein A7985_22720 [Pseudoalteromonas luteoviolacea]|uniref:Uncharacterized protein n=1 Tax=Pseudoalteromonas luteoviolacea TaxID=43657 RepID=A0A1C0TJW9_9GAMM|nr:SDR family NAD(P)-dependent oxidoreductase [Pseudoalteromonas luteoviolacea]OCQ18832.1 hypothetical protein A7985_22720 [Pseudoalteromonas luteoviolacea]